LGGVHHDGDAGDIRLRGDQLEERGHRLHGVEHALVHVDVDDLGAVFHLLLGDVEGGGVVAFHHQALEARRAGDIAALPHVDEQGAGGDVEGFEPVQAAGGFQGRHRAGRPVRDGGGDGADMVRGGATAATDDIDETAVGELADDGGGLLRAFVVAAEGVGQAGVGVHAHQGVGDA